MAGIGRCDISPAPATPQGGWGAQTHQRGLGSDLPMYATAVVLSDGCVSVAIVDVDAIGFDQEVTYKIISAITSLTNIPRDQVRVSCTHTHAGPNTFRLTTITEGLDMALSYLDALPLRIAGTVWQAQQNLEPVRCAAGAGECTLSVNRRLKLETGEIVVGNNFGGPVDPTVRVVRLDSLNEKPLATIIHFACHPTTMAWQCEHFTPDFPGVARQVVEKQLGGTCLFLQGAAGNVHPRGGFTGDLSVYRRLGTVLGLEAAKVATQLTTLPYEEKISGVIQSGAPIAIYERVATNPPSPSLRIMSRQLNLPLGTCRSISELEATAAKAREYFEWIAVNGKAEEVRLARSRATQALAHADRARRYYGKTHLDWELQAIRVGSIAFLSMPGEPFIELNHAIVSESPFEHTLVSGYSNGGFGYLPVATAFQEGGYEIDLSPFSPEAPQIVQQEAAKILRELAQPLTQGVSS